MKKQSKAQEVAANPDQTDICPACKGTGWITVDLVLPYGTVPQNHFHCSSCQGTGRIQQLYTDSGGVRESGDSYIPKNPPKEVSEPNGPTTEAVADGSIAEPDLVNIDEKKPTNSTDSPPPGNPLQESLEDFMVKFEHELNVSVAALDKEFDGRLGDRRASLKRNMARFTRYYVSNLLAAATARAERRGARALAEELTERLLAGVESDEVWLVKEIRSEIKAALAALDKQEKSDG